MSILLDTNVALYFLGGKLSEPLPDGDHYLSVISELELLCYPQLTSKEEQQIRSFVSTVTVINLSDEIKEKTIGLRKKNAIKLPDAIILATAQALDAELLTNDKRLSKISTVRCRIIPVKQDSIDTNIPNMKRR